MTANGLAPHLQSQRSQFGALHLPIGGNHSLHRRDAISSAPKIKRLISLCRTEIVYARVMLARSPGPEHRRLLSGLIENRELFIRMVSENYDDEMENIDREIESVLTH
jgi:hypothetical protein